NPTLIFPDNLPGHLRDIDDFGGLRRGARHAAVVALLHSRGDIWHVPFVQRRADAPDHPGQVALPGGGIGSGETAWEAALRELHEEVAVRPEWVRPLGAGTPVYTSVSNYAVVPFVATVSRE